MPDSDAHADPRRVYELLVKQMLHGLNREERRTLQTTGPMPIAVSVDVGPCSTTYPRLQIPTSTRQDGQAFGLITDQFGDLILLDTRSARRPLTGVLHAADRTDEQLPDALDEEQFDGGDDIPEASEPQSDALDVDDEDSSPEANGATIWGASFALSNPCDVEVSVSGATACPVTIHGATRSDRPFPGRRLRWREGAHVLSIHEGSGSVDFELPLCDADPSEESNDRLEAAASWRASRSEDLEGEALLVHLSISLAQSTLPEDHPEDLYTAKVELAFPADTMRPLPSRSTRNAMFDQVRRMAVGHNCAATWECHVSGDSLTLCAWPTWDERRAKHGTAIPAIPTRDDLHDLVAGYRQHLSHLLWEQLPQELRASNQRSCQQLLASAEETLRWLEGDDNRWQVFQDACKVIMGSPVKSPDGWELDVSGSRTWRPFQLLFFLAAARSTVTEGHPDNERVDVIAFPTGGGKTEAYLLLSAFVLLYLRRASTLIEESPRPGTRVLMRYPLRLLAAQQLQRAAAMTGKLSILVGTYKAKGEPVYGKSPCYIGLWAGSSLTPNTIKQAKSSLHDSSKSRDGSSRALLPLAECPLCGGAVKGEIRKKSGHETAVIACTGDDPQARPCYFRDRNKMWVRWVDEDIYLDPPEFLIATQDKLAIAPWVAQQVRHLFTESMTLVIQDELHMLDDELGSLEGAYQPYLDQRTGPVKVIASSATTKNTSRQVRLLYNRTRTLLIPAPELNDQDWYVSKPDDELVRTTVTGLMPSPRVSGLQARLLLLSAQMQAAQQLFRMAEESRESPHRAGIERAVDALWTNLVYFGSRPLLRETAVLLRRDITRQVNAFRFTFNLPGTGRAQWLRDHSLLEASSESESSVTEIIEALERSLDFVPSDDALSAARVCLATSMIEVGIDVDRLGLMTFIGHPKETNSYIQAGGRIGRQVDLPGLTYVLYRPFSLRDVSIYEDFLAYHQQRNDMVEPALLAPFAPGALRRTLPHLAVLRYADTLDPETPLSQEGAEHLTECLRAARQQLERRFKGQADLTWLASYTHTLESVALAALQQRGPTMPVAARADLSSRSEPRGLLVPLERKQQLDEAGLPLYWFGPTSLRTVAGEVLAGITRPAFDTLSRAVTHSANQASEKARPTLDEEEEA